MQVTYAHMKITTERHREDTCLSLQIFDLDERHIARVYHEWDGDRLTQYLTVYSGQRTADSGQKSFQRPHGGRGLQGGQTQTIKGCFCSFIIIFVVYN